jgi:hypothetical protein
MNEHVGTGALEAVLDQELVLAESVILRDRGDNRLASDIRERHASYFRFQPDGG